MAKVRCPICGKELVVDRSKAQTNSSESVNRVSANQVVRAVSPPLPFCSKRCQMVDLDGWFSERYAVAGETTSGEKEIGEEKLSDELRNPLDE